jgi:hypothetical protein
MNRENLISNLKNELDYINRQLIRTYSVRNLVYFLELEKEVQVQMMYLKMEKK